MNNMKSGLNMDASTLTLQEGMHHWLFNVLLLSSKQKSASFEKHENNYRNYIENRTIGCIKIQNSNSGPFQDYYNELYKKGIDLVNPHTKKKMHTSVSSAKIFDLNKTIRAFFTWCIKMHYTLDNPCTLKNIDIPRKC